MREKLKRREGREIMRRDGRSKPRESVKRRELRRRLKGRQLKRKLKLSQGRQKKTQNL